MKGEVGYNYKNPSAMPYTRAFLYGKKETKLLLNCVCACATVMLMMMMMMMMMMMTECDITNVMLRMRMLICRKVWENGEGLGRVVNPHLVSVLPDLNGLSPLPSFIE